MIIRVLVLATLVLGASAGVCTAEADYAGDPKSLKVDRDKTKTKDKDKDKNRGAVSVPDGDAATGLLLSLGVLGLGVFALRQGARRTPEPLRINLVADGTRRPLPRVRHSPPRR